MEVEQVNGLSALDSSIDFDRYINEVPVTKQRLPYLQPEDDKRISHTGKPLLSLSLSRHDLIF